MASSLALNQILCSDPIYGSVYSTLLSGGSWYEADQQYWRLRYDQMAEELGSLLLTKPTKAAQERALQILGDLRAAAAQLPCNPTIERSVNEIAQIVAQWVPKTPLKRSRNLFDALEEE